ncbi:hypothetical protein FNH05_22315 [Amycolatopsis rhizosphaerae]|uniref:Uncharacterized protein n=1 Tax=Amycolatopsis rhizosphaerae TaxID=2053003 RepID=A0A558C129_9PSEU|nr:hypothetical protein [Amycolatopsis rhizosphaerae]TVT42422.1 hypothetical protein FNH05_22315 [Amycolatopsis rhizosphaerae]
MRVKDAGGERWSIRRKFTPWHRVFQPVNLASGTYLRYRVEQPSEKQRNALANAKQRREKRKAERESRRDEREISGWQWLYLLPLLLVAAFAVGAVGQAVEAFVYLVQFLIWLVVLPFYLVELLLRFVVGGVLWLARATGLARTRIDVVGGGERIASLTRILVPGYGNAGHLVRALGETRSKASWPFDPVREPEVARLLAGARAEVVEHTGWQTEPSPVVTGE